MKKLNRALAVWLIALIMLSAPINVLAQSIPELRSTVTSEEVQEVIKEGNTPNVVYEISDTNDFEPISDALQDNNLSGYSFGTGSISFSDETENRNHTPNGVQCMKITPSSTDPNGNFGVYKNYEDSFYGKMISAYLYDDMDPNRILTIQLKEEGTNENNVLSFGIKDNKYTAFYKDPAGKYPSVTVTTIKRSEGWHEFKANFTSDGKVMITADGEKLAEIVITQEAAKQMKCMRFAKYWNVNNTGIPKTLPVYVDDITISLPAPVPTDAKEDDFFNTFDWTYAQGKTNPADYEYSLDGGVSYNDCLEKPLNVGNKSFEIGSILLRCKAPELADYVYPSITNGSAYTESVNTILSMEDISDLEYFQQMTDRVLTEEQKPLKALSETYSHSGLTSMKIVPGIGNTFDQGTMYGYDTIVKNKVVTMWFYDQMNMNSGYKENGFVELKPNSSNRINSLYMGISVGNDSASKNYYSYRLNWGTGVTTSIKRTEGWHSLQWDFSSGINCDAYIDGIKVVSYPTEGFNHVSITDYWNTGVKYIHYFDDLSITDTREEVPVIPNAPTNPVTDNINHTFGWSNVPGYEEASLYEISTDNGLSFTECTSNPQSVPDKSLAAGTVIVRLKAAGGNLPGAVLRNKERFMNSDSAMIEKINSYISFCGCANPKDYTEESWNSLQVAIAVAKEAVSAKEGLEKAYDVMYTAGHALVSAMEHEVIHTFKDQEVPVAPVYGTPVWGEYENISFLTEKSYKIKPAIIDGNQCAKLTYTFPTPLKEKQIVYYLADNNVGTITLTASDSESGTASIITTGSGKYLFYDVVNGVKGNVRDLRMKRRSDVRKIEINMTNGKGTQIYMDSILVYSNPLMLQIDSLDFMATNNGSTRFTYVSIDELTFRDKNAVTKISYPEDVVDLGYYDTYEMNVTNYILEKPYDYETTDKFTYTIEDSSIAKMTKGGSIQPMALEGTTKATITSGNGISSTITVNVHNYRVSGVAISDELVTLNPHLIDEITMRPGDIKAVNAIITPENATNLKKTWESKDSTVAEVTGGMIQARKEGTTVITVTTEDGNHTASLIVKVKEKDSDYGKELFVSEKDGNDFTGDGTIDAPFQTIERARDELRTLCSVIEGGAVVYLREGTYIISRSIMMETADGGDEKNPVKYMSYQGEKVTLKGAYEFKVSEFSKVTDEAVLDKLPSTARGKVYQKDISSSIDDALKVFAQGYIPYVGRILTENGINVSKPYYNVSFNGQPMTLSRWPNEGANISGCSYPGYSKIDTVVYRGANIRNWHDDQKGNPSYVTPENRNVFDGFKVRSNQLTARMKTWKGIAMDGTSILDENIWYNGYTGVDYTIQTSPIETIMPDGTIESYIAATYAATNASYARLYVFNLIQELDIPGEWYIDTKSKVLYIYPPEGVDMSGDKKISVSVLTDPMIQMEDTQYITFEGMELTDSLGHAVVMNGGNHNTISRCEISNISSNIANICDSKTQMASYNGFDLCNVTNVNGGVIIDASEDYDHLTPGHNYVNGCVFENYSTLTTGFNPAVTLHGVGNAASCNEISNAPNNAIMWQGNDHVIEFNNIHHVDKQTTDTAAIYTGRNALNRGTVIKNNWIHHIGKNGNTTSKNIGIYLDDMSAGMRVYDNVIENIYWAVYINGGQDNYVTNNTFKDCHYGIIATDWSYYWLSRWYQHGYGYIMDSTATYHTTVEWWKEDSPYAKYPHCQTIFKDAPNDSIYNKVINNYYPGTAELFEYRNRGMMANETELMKDWFFSKGNVK